MWWVPAGTTQGACSSVHPGMCLTVPVRVVSTPGSAEPMVDGLGSLAFALVSTKW